MKTTVKHMKITIERGTHQIGGCATVFSTEKHRIVIDCGANLPNTDMENSMTDAELLDRLFHRGEPCDGVLFSHYHGDHIGLYKEILPYRGASGKKSDPDGRRFGKTGKGAVFPE